MYWGIEHYPKIYWLKAIFIILHNSVVSPGGCPAFWTVTWGAGMAGRAKIASLALLAVDTSC